MSVGMLWEIRASHVRAEHREIEVISMVLFTDF